MEANNESICFKTKFLAYSLSASGIQIKRYVYPPFRIPISGINAGTDTKQLRALSLALESPHFSTLDTERFSLYEISFRGARGTDSLSFNFMDSKGSEYLSAAELFGSINGFDVHRLIEATEKLEKSVFPFGVSYNPNWMFGLLFEQSSLVAVKEGMRFDPDGTLDFTRRQEVISRITEAHGAPERLKDELHAWSRWLYGCGFFFRILGIDQDASGELRYKFYFRSDGKEDSDVLRSRLVDTMEDSIIKRRVDEIFRSNQSGMWGIGISVGNMSKIDRFQLYFHP